MCAMRLVRRKLIPVGIDPASTHLALVSFTGKASYVTALYRLAKRSGPEACGAAVDAVHDFMAKLPDAKPFVLIEGPVLYGNQPGRNRSTVAQSQVVGAVMATLQRDYGAHIELVAPSTWKKQALGNGKLDKPGVAKGLQLRWPSLFARCEGRQDVIDAACIALVARQRAESPQARRSSR